jgi:transaldolase
MKIDDLNIKIFADGANSQSILELNEKNFIKGFTTNPSLMRKAGIKDYKSFVLEILPKINNKPISFEIFADDLEEMKHQAEEISSWGKNIFVKIPITNTKKKSTNEIIRALSSKGIKLNITAIFTNQQLSGVLKCLNKEIPTILSVFAGRIADAGYDAEDILKESVRLTRDFTKVEILWASTRELYNIIQAQNCGCHIITVPHDMLSKIKNFGKDLDEFSLETVKGFYKDALEAKFKI